MSHEIFGTYFYQKLLVFFYLIGVLAFIWQLYFQGDSSYFGEFFFPFPGLIDTQTNTVLCSHVPLQSHLESSLRAQPLPEILQEKALYIERSKCFCWRWISHCPAPSYFLLLWLVAYPGNFIIISFIILVSSLK